MPLQFAIIGCGRIAERHAENIVKTSNISAVCDVIKERADHFSAKYDATAYYCIDELLLNEKKLDVAVLCTPNGLHASQSIACLKASLHVLCEKPLCTNSHDGKKMIAAANEYNKNLFVVKQNRFNPPVTELKKLLDEKKLGKIFSFQINCFWNRPAKYFADPWRGTRALDGGTLFTQFSHFIDLLYWTLGEVKNVNGFKKNYAHPEIEFEDTGIASLEMENGVIGSLNYTLNSFKQNMEGSFTIFGEKGTLKIGGEYLNKLEYQLIEGYEIKNLPPANASNNYGFYQGTMSNHDKVYENLFEALDHHKNRMVDAEEGLKTIEIIERIYKASQ